MTVAKALRATVEFSAENVPLSLAPILEEFLLVSCVDKNKDFFR